MKKLIPICVAMLISAPIFAQSGSSTSTPSGTSPSGTSMGSDTNMGSGSTMSQPSGSGSTTTPKSLEEERMEEKPASGATVPMNSGSPTDSTMNPASETDTDSTSP